MHNLVPKEQLLVSKEWQFTVCRDVYLPIAPSWAGAITPATPATPGGHIRTKPWCRFGIRGGRGLEVHTCSYSITGTAKYTMLHMPLFYIIMSIFHVCHYFTCTNILHNYDIILKVQLLETVMDCSKQIDHDRQTTAVRYFLLKNIPAKRKRYWGWKCLNNISKRTFWHVTNIYKNINRVELWKEP